MSIEETGPRPGSEALLADAVAACLEAARRKGVPASELAEAVGGAAAGASGPEIVAAAEALQDSGEAVEWNRRWIALQHTPWRAGRVQGVSGGDALIWTLPAGRSNARPEAAFFVARRGLKGARDGDRVLVQPRRRSRGRGGKQGRAVPAHHLPEAAVVKVLARRDRMVGRVDLSGGYCRLLPFDAKVKLEVELPRGDGLRLEGQYVVAEVDPSPGDLANRAQGRVVEELGRLSRPGVDVRVALRHFEIPEDLAPEAVAESEAHPEEPSKADQSAEAGREDLRDLVTVTIDGETARDFDDAISVEALGEGGFRLGVHIADVSHYVAEGSALDVEAYRRGTSVYFPERAVPMLSERLSNGLCSLRPDVPRLTLSAFLDVARDGEVRKRRFAESVIRSHRRLTYSEVQRILEEPSPTDADEYGASVLGLLGRARDLKDVLLRARSARGSIDFDLPSGDVILDTDGVTVGIRPGERTVAHRIVEECMIAANEAVAAELAEAQVPALFRIHEEPDKTRIAELIEILAPLGIELLPPGSSLDEPIPPQELQRVLREVEGHAEEPFVASLVLRTMERARYRPENLGHYALASTHYTHFTSPIRRYPDLLVHRQLRNHLRGRAVEEDVKTLLTRRLPAIAEHTSMTERRAERAERVVLQWKALRLLRGREGEVLRGRVTGVKHYGLFVRLVDVFTDGLVPVDALTDDFYDYLPDEHRLVGAKTGRKFRLADEIDVVLTGVDIHRRMVDLAIDGMPPPPARTEGDRSRGRGEGRRRRRPDSRDEGVTKAKKGRDSRRRRP